MKYKFIKTIMVIILCIMFISVIVLTNDSIKQMMNMGVIIPAIVFIMIILACITLLYCKKNK